MNEQAMSVIPRKTEPRRVVATPDDVIGPGERRHFKGQTFGEARLTTNVDSLCYPYRCTLDCPHPLGELRLIAHPIEDFI